MSRIFMLGCGVVINTVKQGVHKEHKQKSIHSVSIIMFISCNRNHALFIKQLKNCK